MTSETSDDFRAYFTAAGKNSTPPLSTTGTAREIINRHTVNYP
jgi:hypothetical protein